MNEPPWITDRRHAIKFDVTIYCTQAIIHHLLWYNWAILMLLKFEKLTYTAGIKRLLVIGTIKRLAILYDGFVAGILDFRGKHNWDVS